MAVHYVRSAASGLNNGTSWANAFTTLSGAAAAGNAGDTYFVSEDHAESSGSDWVVIFDGTANGPDKIICVDHNGSVPPVSADLRTSATISTTGGTSIRFTGGLYIYGLTFSCATSGTSPLTVGTAYPFNIVLDQCTLKLGSSSGGRISFGQNGVPSSTSARIELRNTNLFFSSASAGITLFGTPVLWRGGAVQNVAPTTLFLSSGPSTAAYADVRDVDLSLIGSSKYLVDAAISTPGNIKFTNCKLSSSLAGVVNGTLPNSISNQGRITVDLIICDSGTNTSREEHYQYAGYLKQETFFVRNGGATDGVTPKSWKAETGSGAKYLCPLLAPDIFQWIDSTGSKTLEVQTLTDGVTLNTNEAWLEVEYMGDSGSPRGTFISTAADVLSSGSALPASAEIWQTTGMSSPETQILSATVTVNQKGWFRVRPVLARANTIVYIDPLVTVI
jgi:hypothetical protein